MRVSSDRAELNIAMAALAFKLVMVLALLNFVAVAAEDTEDDDSFDASSIESRSYGSSSFGSSDSRSLDSGSSYSGSSDSGSSDSGSSDTRSSDTTPEEPSPPPSSALSQIGPLLSLIQPVLGGILNGATSETENGATYPPLLKPIFSPLPFFPGLGIIPSSIAAQASDLLASAAASARERFAKVARENAARSQANYGHILNAFNELNMAADNTES